jgi:hypothetical protein
VQADVCAPVKRDRAVRNLNLPQGDHIVAVGNESGRIVGPFTGNTPSQAVAEKTACAFENPNAQSDVIDAEGCGYGLLYHCDLHPEFVLAQHPNSGSLN